MKILNNKGEVIGEINTIFTKQGVVTTNTVFNNDRAVYQHISVRDNQGKVAIEDVIGGKLIP